MFKKYYEALSQPLNMETASSMADFILSGEANDLEISALLASLNQRPQAYEVMTGFSSLLKSRAIDMNIQATGLIDVCGTGGDGHNTFNISTTVAILLSCLVPVAKHGNSSVSSKSGSADLLKVLGVPFYAKEEDISDALIKNNFVFLFAPYMHPSMKRVMPVRKALAIPTIFNRIGPLCNPLPLTYQIIGVYDQALMLPMARSMQAMGIKRGAVIHGHMGMDELSTTGINQVVYVTPDELRNDIIDPASYQMPYGEIKDYVGGDAHENAEITIDILSGVKGTKADVVALNTGFALYIAEVAPSISQGVEMAYKLLNEQIGLKKLNEITGAKYEHTR